MSQPLQNRFAQLRFITYIGAQLVALAVPLLIFNLTHSLTFAGLALLIEWLPKLGLYFSGGALVWRFGERHCLLVLNILRTAVFAALALVCFGYGTVWVVVICAALYQCANAVSNVLFENLVTQHWPPEQRASGHARLMKCDQLGCMVALIFGLLTLQPLALVLGGLISQFICLFVLARCHGYLAPARPPSAGRALTQVWQQLGRDIHAVKQADLLSFSAMSMLLAIPFCCLFSVLAFYLNRAQPGVADNAQVLSLILLGKTVLGAGVLSWLQQRLSKVGHENRYGIAGMLILVLGAALASQSFALPAAIGLLFIISLGWMLYQPWVRSLRQELVARHVPESSRGGATGILISVEALSYLLAGGLLFITRNQLDLALLFAAALAAAGLCWRLLALPSQQNRALVPVQATTD
jgi:MFS family permease